MGGGELRSWKPAPDVFAHATSQIWRHTMQNATMRQLTRPKQCPANDNGPSRTAGSADRPPRHMGRLVFLGFGLLGMTIVSCLRGIGAVEIFLWWA